MWLYGSGFPKSMAIDKGIESKLLSGSANPKDFKNLEGEKVESGNWGISKMANEQGARPSDYSADKHLRVSKVNHKTELGKQWQGWGTCLKPSYEPIIVARKPLDGTCVDNVIKWGVGGINIDECRVPFNGDKWENQKSGKTAKAFNLNEQQRNAGTGVLAGYECKANDNGRFPANTILTYDDTDFEEVCGGFPNTKENANVRHNKNDGKGYNCYSNYGDCDTRGYDDSGSASRYFYCAKASKKDRDEGLEEFEGKKVNDGRQTPIDNAFQRGETPRKNVHPTVKPTTLMQYLVRLVTPKGGTILDPFMGSGSTGKAVAFENKERQANYSFIGIEKETEYCEIAKARIEFADNYREETEDNQISFKDFME